MQTYSVLLYCNVLMENHYHFFIETPLGNVSEFMRHFNVTYTSHYNRKHRRTGHLFQGRYKSILVEKEEYAVMLSRYIHLNPVRTKEYEGRPGDEKMRRLMEDPFSSLPGYVDADRRNSMVTYTPVLDSYGGDTLQGRKAYRKAISEDISGGIEIHGKIVAQSILGSEHFIERFVKSAQGAVRELPAARRIREYKAKERVFKAMEDECGLSMQEILHERGHPRRIAMDFLYCYGGLKGPEIGLLFGVDYSTVSQSRKRLRTLIEKDEAVRTLYEKIRARLSR